jgi:hypothetical protein
MGRPGSARPARELNHVRDCVHCTRSVVQDYLHAVSQEGSCGPYEGGFTPYDEHVCAARKSCRMCSVGFIRHTRNV